jgi:glycosyltransferase involved in cell wall biosynthesis
MTGTSLRILHTEASCGWGGQEIRILEEAAGLRERGHDVRIATPAEAPIFVEAKRRSIPVHAAPLHRRRVSSLVALAKIVAGFRPHVIVTHSSSDSWLAALTTLRPSLRVPLVRTRHLSTPVAPGVLNRWLYGRVPARVVTTGEAIRVQLIGTLGLEPESVVSIPSGVDISRFRPGDRSTARAKLGLPQQAAIVGIVATLRSWKGHRFLLSAMRDPRLAVARLVIVGDGPQDSSLRRQAADLGDRVLFAGRQDDVVPWLHAFDLFALPSTGHEGVPQALMQAMACGLPVVTTPVGAIPEIVVDGDTGILVRSEDPTALADSVVQVLNDSALRERLSAAARRHAATRFTASAMLDAMENVMRQASHGRF